MANATEQLKDMETLFTALADGTRLRLLNLMRDEEVCVCFFTEVLNESQPKISRHLAFLRKAGIVESRREGKWVHYRIVDMDDSGAGEIIDRTLAWLNSQQSYRREYENLVSVCCSPTAPVTIARAPKPEALIESPEAGRRIPAGDEIETFLL
jgi:ArsR family transcriptional regulator